MAEYRLFFLGSDGAIEARHDFAAPDDAAALQIMSVVGKASADAHCGVMLWQGTRRLFEIGGAEMRQSGDGKDHCSLGGVTAANLNADTQQRVLDNEEALLRSHWRLAKSRMLLEATAEMQRGRTTPAGKA